MWGFGVYFASIEFRDDSHQILVNGMIHMAALISTTAQLLADVVLLVALRVRPVPSVQAENLLLGRQLALFKERGIKSRRVNLLQIYGPCWRRVN